MCTTTKRDTYRDILLNCGDKNILLEMATGSGKTKMAIELIAKRTKSEDKVLIVVPRLVLITTWKDEFIKWGYKDLIDRLTFVTYVSYPKVAGEWKMVIYDECHHLSERCREVVPYFKAGTNILLSATVGRNLKREIKVLFPYLRTFSISTRDAIQDSILPDPKVILIPLNLDNKERKYSFIRNKGKGNSITIPFERRWKYSGYTGEVCITCTQLQYYMEISRAIDWWKKKISVASMKKIYLHKCGERLKWLSKEKTDLAEQILSYLDKERTLTFCSSIEQTEKLGKYCINSKNKRAVQYLDDFNKGKISHITACAMIDEGTNLSNCRIFIFANLNSSDRLIIQRTGRALRHPDPIIIIPYFSNTRDEEIVNKMCENYNKQLITTIHNIKDICVITEKSGQ